MNWLRINTALVWWFGFACGAAAVAVGFAVALFKKG